MKVNPVFVGILFLCDCFELFHASKYMSPEDHKLESIGLKVADHVTAMLAYWDKDLVCRFANAAYRDWFGKTREEMVDKMTIRELLGPLYEKNLPYIKGALEGKVQTFERDIPVHSGGTRSSIANYFPDIVDGEVRGFFVHVADISQIKLLEKEIIRSNDLIKEQNRRLLSFSNIVSHNLRSYANNLTAILELFVTASSDKEKQMLFHHLQSISKGFSSTIAHLNEIVEIQNLNTLQLESINLHDYVDNIIQVLGVQVQACHAVVQNKVSAEAEILANPAYMESILLNLLTNAIKYRHPERRLIIELTSAQRENGLELCVKDNGLGIDLGKYGKDIFGMYKTFHKNADAKGIGLFITKLQVEAMQGAIAVQSEEHRGTSFIIHFSRQPTRQT